MGVNVAPGGGVFVIVGIGVKVLGGVGVGSRVGILVTFVVSRLPPCNPREVSSGMLERATGASSPDSLNQNAAKIKTAKKSKAREKVINLLLIEKISRVLLFRQYF